MNDERGDNNGPTQGVNKFQGSNVQRQALPQMPHVKMVKPIPCCCYVVAGREPVSRGRWPGRYGQNRPVQLFLVVPQQGYRQQAEPGGFSQARYC